MSAIRPPSRRQLDLMRAIHRLSERSGMPPTIRELLPELHVRSTNAIECLLDAAARKGLVLKAARSSRTIQLTPAGRAFVANNHAAAVALWPRRCPRCDSDTFVAHPASLCEVILG